MFVLVETSAGYAVFKLKKDLDKIDNIYKQFLNEDGINNLLQLEKFVKFKDLKEGLTEAIALGDGKVTKKLKKLVKKLNIVQLGEKLVVTDPSLGKQLHEKFGLSVVSNADATKLRKCIIDKFEFLTSIGNEERDRLNLGLSHSLNRYRLKCNPDKIDTMIVQAISFLDDLDKSINNYVMRCKEMYGWHFPELAKTINDNNIYIALVKHIGRRDNALTEDLSGVLPEEFIEPVRDAARTSCGNQITDDDLAIILNLCNIINNFNTRRANLFEYLKTRMVAIAPNLTAMVGEVLGARLIAHAGTLMNLAKHPSSTIQILGAEKALFRALKTKHQTPKYGLLFHASLVGQTSTKNKGKISRMLANKTALSTRIDALGDSDEITAEQGVKFREFIERMRKLLDSGNYVTKTGSKGSASFGGKPGFKRPGGNSYGGSDVKKRRF